jgi:transposase-like protein
MGAKINSMASPSRPPSSLHKEYLVERAGLKGLPEAIEAVFPQTQVQLCIVYKVRKSLKYVPWKERKAVAADLRAIYASATLPEAEHALERFAER